jgi:hypothetical protein
MKSQNIVLIGILATASLLIIAATIGIHSVKAAPITLDIKKAKNPGPGFADEKIGTVSIDSSANKTAISSNLSVQPKQDKVFEGWLADSGGSNYKLSLGKYEGGTLKFNGSMVNPYTYKQFLVTEEPVHDVDPNAADTYGGTDLPTPFGQ